MNKIYSILLLMLVCCTGNVVYAEAPKTGSIVGKVMIKDGMPMANGLVFIFNEASGAPPSFDRYWRVPDEVVKTDADGKFRAVLTEGKYYLGAIKRKLDDEIGPLQEGDVFLPFYANGTPIRYTVSTGTSADAGIITGAQIFSKSTLKTGAGVTAIEGLVTDSRGKPLENALVFAFTTPSMLGKPLFISEKTGKDGKYLLRLFQGGGYYLKIRNFYGGGAMKAGEIMGSYGQETPAVVEVKTGEVVKGINITGTTFLGQGPRSTIKK
jgi:hypothetical protein